MEAILIELLRNWPWALIALLYVLACWWLFGNAVTSKKDADWLQWLLEEPRGLTRYRALFAWVLGRIDRALTPRNVVDNGLERLAPMARDAEMARADGRAAFGWPVLDLVFRIALAYPVLLLFANWAVLGVEGRVGELAILPPEPPWWVRAGTLIGLALLIVSLFLPTRARVGRRRRRRSRIRSCTRNTSGARLVGASGAGRRGDRRSRCRGLDCACSR